MRLQSPHWSGPLRLATGNVRNSGAGIAKKLGIEPFHQRSIANLNGPDVRNRKPQKSALPDAIADILRTSECEQFLNALVVLYRPEFPQQALVIIEQFQRTLA